MGKASHKRILKNTFMLYIRMLLAMVVGLYTSRVALEVLGVQDFGTYHVVAGFVALLGFMQGAMTTATQRYFAYDIGNKSGANLHRLFNTSVQVHLLIGSCIFLVAETVGYWFVSTKLNIPSESLGAALIAYHLSVVTFFISVMTVPLTAMLMAHERMKQFALMGILDVVLKLLAILFLPYLSVEKLAGYAGLLFFVALIIFSGYCYLHLMYFPSIRLSWRWDKSSFLNMIGFTGWNTWGNLAAAMSEHGNNILVNIFFGPAVNAGRTIASQANSAVNSFVSNIQAAANPQIVKLYASEQREEMHRIIVCFARYNFLICFVIGFLFIAEAENILSFWLSDTPPYAVVFLKLAIVSSLINSLSGPLMTAAQATGHIRLYHTVVGGILLLNVPVSGFFLYLGNPPETVAIVFVFFSIVALAARIIIISPLIELRIGFFISNAVYKAFLVSFVAYTMVFSLNYLAGGFNSFFVSIFVNFILVFLTVLFFGLEKYERQKIIKLLKARIK